MSMIDYVLQATTEYIEHMPKSMRKKYGQFFTSKETAIFMAELLDIPVNKDVISVLDPGAGSGILSVALIERLQAVPSIKRIEIVCYENDSNVLDLLRSNLEWACNQTSKEIVYHIASENYILSQMVDYNFMLGVNPNPPKYDLIIGNPPYMKIAKDAPEALAMPDVCYGAPNLYFLFATMSLFNLRENGEMVYIINALQVPAKQQNGMCCCVLLAMANLLEDNVWGDATNDWIRIHDVIAFANGYPHSISRWCLVCTG